ncbi:MAG: dihydroorotate dehydrogenase [Candidatus Omnitrophota bacterium]
MNLTIRLNSKFKLKNPVTVASGTFGYAEEFKDFIDLNLLGAIFTKTITRFPKSGNPPPRLVETSSGMLNAIGLQNEGVEDFIKNKWPHLRELGPKIIASISAINTEDFVYLARYLEDAGIEAVELNLSCPNVKYAVTCSRKKFIGNGNPVMFAQSDAATYNVVKAVRKKTDLFLIAKLSPNVTDITAIARAAESAGTDALSLINTFLAMAIDIHTNRPKLANITGGLSGPAIKPLALRMVYEACRSVKIPVIGMGGIMNAADAVEFMIAGAKAVSIGTANFVNPHIAIDILYGIKKYLKDKRIDNINKIVGKIKLR